MPAPKKEVALEVDGNEDDFKEELTKGRYKQVRLVKIFRSVLMVPPSNRFENFGLTDLLSCTQDLSIFDTKLIQIYLQKRFRASLWFLVLHSVLILGALFFLFLYVAFFRTPFLIIPVLLVQSWNLAI